MARDRLVKAARQGEGAESGCAVSLILHVSVELQPVSPHHVSRGAWLPSAGYARRVHFTRTYSAPTFDGQGAMGLSRRISLLPHDCQQNLSCRTRNDRWKHLKVPSKRRGQDGARITIIKEAMGGEPAKRRMSKPRLTQRASGLRLPCS
ncbi:hypothetical protein NDU88_001483 [Pleurodeles waltl]|uniref:Uncharacterized protein n=1 Tax=Pleurodeles waltl TaxID=8319 RepID=A0AAV7M0L4_PLEWA|nr:hypothetical protein NDU88_001483 [Pleurodeles waltl]